MDAPSYEIASRIVVPRGEGETVPALWLIRTGKECSRILHCNQIAVFILRRQTILPLLGERAGVRAWYRQPTAFEVSTNPTQSRFGIGRNLPLLGQKKTGD